MDVSGHTKITNNALNTYFNHAELDLILKSNVDADESYNRNKKHADNYNINAQHSNRTDLKECEKFLKDSEEVVIEDFITAAKNTNSNNEDEKYIKAFYDLGRLTHCIQDFYSHTNWINQTGAEVRVWNESATNPNIDNPKNLKTGKYKYKITDTFAPVAHFFQKLFKKEKSYEKTYVENDGKTITHYMLNKDEEGTVADKAFKAKEGISGFKLACDDATKHTNEEWQEINGRLKESLDSKTYEKLQTKLKSFNPSEKESKEMLKKCRTNFNDKMGEVGY